MEQSPSGRGETHQPAEHSCSYGKAGIYLEFVSSAAPQPHDGRKGQHLAVLTPGSVSPSEVPES